MSIYQTNTNEYTAYFAGFKGKGKTHADALMECLWNAREARFIKISIN